MDPKKDLSRISFSDRKSNNLFCVCLHCCVVDHVENCGRLIESRRCTTVCVDLAVAIAGVDDEIETGEVAVCVDGVV